METWEKAFKECDLRGPYPEQVDEDLAYRLGLAVAASVPPMTADGRPTVVVAGDVRLSTPALRANLIDGLRDGGAEVLDCGLVATPVFYFARRQLRSRSEPSGVMVTASHSPADQNGFKPILGPLPITPEELSDLRRLVADPPAPTTGGSVRAIDVRAAYVELTVARWAKALAEAPLRGVVDAGNGSFSDIAPEVMAGLDLDFEPMFCEADGRFPNRSPDVSRPEALDALAGEVIAAGADLGVAFDGDGDRVAFVDEKGSVVPTDVFIALLARDALEREGPGPVVLDIKLSMAVEEVVRAARGTPVRERSGHTFMKTRVIGERAVLGGEASGHVFFRELEGGDDGLFAALTMLDLLARAGQPMSKLAESVPRYALTRDVRVGFEGDVAEVLERLARKAAGEARVETIDGVKAHYEDGWALARASVTEPALTMRFEGVTREALRRAVERFLAPAPEFLDAAMAAAAEGD
jgi:phosphomannomutase/phosphoglucomutase